MYKKNNSKNFLLICAPLFILFSENKAIDISSTKTESFLFKEINTFNQTIDGFLNFRSEKFIKYEDLINAATEVYLTTRDKQIEIKEDLLSLDPADFIYKLAAGKDFPEEISLKIKSYDLQTVCAICQARCALERLRSAIIRNATYPYAYLRDASFYTILQHIRSFLVNYKEMIISIIGKEKGEAVFNKAITFLTQYIDDEISKKLGAKDFLFGIKELRESLPIEVRGKDEGMPGLMEIGRMYADLNKFMKGIPS